MLVIVSESFLLLLDLGNTDLFKDQFIEIGKVSLNIIFSSYLCAEKFLLPADTVQSTISSVRQRDSIMEAKEA